MNLIEVKWRKMKWGRVEQADRSGVDWSKKSGAERAKGSIASSAKRAYKSGPSRFIAYKVELQM